MQNTVFYIDINVSLLDLVYVISIMREGTLKTWGQLQITVK